MKPIKVPKGSISRDFPVALFVPVVTALLFIDGILTRMDGCILLAAFFGWLGVTIQKARKERSDAESVLGENRARFVILSCIVGLAFLVLAGNFIVVGGKGIAASFGIPEFVVGATIVAVGTSFPELATTIISSLKGHDEIGLGTVLGSNIFNGLFVVGVAAIINPIEMPWQPITIAIVFGIITLLQALPVRGGKISKEQGILLLASYALYVAIVLKNPLH